MATNKELEKQVNSLQKQVSRLNVANSQLLDEVAILKNNYTTLVKEVSKRFEVVQERFQKK